MNAKASPWGLSALFGRQAVVEAAAIDAATLRSDRLRLAREPDWRRLEAIVARLEAGRLRALSDADLADLPVLYRTAVSSLASARETSLDAATLAYLEALVRRAWFQVYGPRTTLFGWLARFFGGEWSAAVRAIAPDIAVGFVLLLAGAVAGWSPPIPPGTAPSCLPRPAIPGYRAQAGRRWPASSSAIPASPAWPRSPPACSATTHRFRSSPSRSASPSAYRR
jgi:hypothetical protein